MLMSRQGNVSKKFIALSVSMANKRVALLLTGLMALLAGCNAQHDVAADAPAFTVKAMPVTKSLKRSIAYNLVSDADLTALAPGVSWWYDWGTAPSSALSYGVKLSTDYETFKTCPTPYLGGT